MSANVATVLAELQRLANPVNVAGMARFGIVGKKLLGITTVQLRTIAKRIGRNHELAEELWASEIFEARILAAFIADPKCLTRRQANAWAKDFECWADCDGLCIHPFRKTLFAHELAVTWSRRREMALSAAGRLSRKPPE